ncbi:MAG: hemerythrin domain-containing protein, partial [Candidatus Scalindua sp.]
MMKQVVNCADPLTRLIKDHKDVSEYLDAFEEILDLLCDENAWGNIKPIEDFFKRKVIYHFKFEEEIVFPAILSRCAKKET